MDHVNDVAKGLHHAQVVKNPDLVRFCEFKQRNSYYDENRSGNSYTVMNEFCFVQIFVLFVVREGPHRGHHVQAEAYQDLTQAVNQA